MFPIANKINCLLVLRASTSSKANTEYSAFPLSLFCAAPGLCSRSVPQILRYRLWKTCSLVASRPPIDGPYMRPRLMIVGRFWSERPQENQIQSTEVSLRTNERNILGPAILLRMHLFPPRFSGGAPNARRAIPVALEGKTEIQGRVEGEGGKDWNLLEPGNPARSYFPANGQSHVTTPWVTAVPE